MQNSSLTMPVSRLYFAERSRLAITQFWMAGIFLLTLFTGSAWNENLVIKETLYSGALILTFVGCLGRVWSLAHIAGRKNDQLVTEGPYSLCRNPLYLFSLIAALGIGMATCTLTIPLAIVIGYAALYPTVIRQEESRLAAIYGEQFETYCQATPKFFPSFRNFRPAAQLLVDMRAFSRGLRDTGWFLFATLVVHLNFVLHETGIGISVWQIW